MAYDPSGRVGTLHRQQQIKARARLALAKSAPMGRRLAAHVVPPSHGPSARVWGYADTYSAELLRRHAEHSPHGPRWRFVPIKEASGASVLLGVATRLRDGDALVLLVDGTGTLREADTARPLTLDQVERRMRG